MATVKNDIEESSDKITKVKRLVKERAQELEYKVIPQTPLVEGISWKDLQFSQPDNVIRIGTVFSGIGAIEHAFQRLGLKHCIAFAGDIDTKCKQSYFANYEISEED